MIRSVLVVCLALLLPALAQGEPPARTDLYGDALPDGALCRIGTVRFRHEGRVLCVRYSPDGKALAACGDDGIRVWDAASGKELVRTPRSSRDIYSVVFHEGGKQLVCSGAEGLCLWDLDTARRPRPVVRPRLGHDTVGSFTGKVLAEPLKNAVELWDLETGKMFRRLEGREQDLWYAAFSADGRTLAAVGRSGRVVLWVVGTGKVARTIPEPTAIDAEGNPVPGELEERTRELALSSDGKVLAGSVAGEDGRVRLWDTATGKELRTLPAAGDTVRGLRFSPDGRLLARAGDRGLRVWDVGSGKPLWHVSATYIQLNGLAFSPDGRTLAAGYAYSVRQWDVSTGRELCRLAGYGHGSGFVSLSPDGRTVTSAGDDDDTSPPQPGEEFDCLRYWQASSGLQMVPRPGQERRFGRVADLSADGRTLVSVGRDRGLHVWEVASGKEICRVPYADFLFAGRLSADGAYLVVWTEDTEQDVRTRDCRLHLWDVRAGKPLRAPLLAYRGTGAYVTFSPDGKQLASVSVSEGVRLWEVPTGRALHRFRSEHPLAYFRVVAFSADGRTLAAGGEGDINLWDVRSGKRIRQLSSPKPQAYQEGGVRAMRFTPDGTGLFVADERGEVVLWDTTTGNVKLRWKAHGDGVWFLAVSADGKVLLTKGVTTTLVWDVNRLQELAAAGKGR